MHRALSAPTRPSRALRGLIRGYQSARAGKPSPCRYWPSCSQYAIEAIELHGSLRGSWLGLRRVARCHPWGGHGVDPVPSPNVCSGNAASMASSPTTGGA